MKRSIFVLAAVFLGLSARAHDGPEKVPPHASMPAASDPETATMQAALRKVIPLLPADQTAELAEGLPFVVPRLETLTSKVLGYAPEDDPEYKYPDQSYYPSGTIKGNISLRTVEALNVADNPKVPSQVRATLYNLFFRVVVHEIEHCMQYRRKPVFPLSKAEECPKGLCDPARIEQTRLRTEYEFAALARDFKEARSRRLVETADGGFRFDDENATRNKQDFLDAAKYLDQHPELLTSRIKNFPDRLRLAAVETEQIISETHRIMYESAYMIPLLGREYLLAQRMYSSVEAGVRDAGDPLGVPLGREHSFSNVRQEEIRRKLLFYLDFDCGRNALKEPDIIRGDYRHVVPVFEAVLGTSKCGPVMESGA
ncbi:MAG: hypothetical protein HY552_03705 [Elusimicrobia bacterium]|nr:hypothetical protein [Elusimicrobiota bacterium]